MGEFSAEEKEAMKAEAGIAACNFVKDGMMIGIGTGSTVKYTILELGRRIREEGLEIAAGMYLYHIQPSLSNNTLNQYEHVGKFAVIK